MRKWNGPHEPENNHNVSLAAKGQVGLGKLLETEIIGSTYLWEKPDK